MRGLAVAIQNENKKVSVIETIKSIKNENWEHSQEEQVKLCKELGLNIIFAHLGDQMIFIKKVMM